MCNIVNEATLDTNCSQIHAVTILQKTPVFQTFSFDLDQHEMYYNSVNFS